MAARITIEEIRKRVSLHGNGRWTLLEDQWRGRTEKDLASGETKLIFYRLICSKHGPFMQTGANLAQMCGGCEECGKSEKSKKVSDAKRLDQKEIKQRISEYSRGRWTLDEDWKGGTRRDQVTRKKIDIFYRLFCSKHGPFTTRGSNLVDKSGGCDKCTAEFISESVSERNRQWAREGRFRGRAGTTTLSQDTVERRVKEKSLGVCEFRDFWRGATEIVPDSGGRTSIVYNLWCSKHGPFTKDGPNLINPSIYGICQKCSAEGKGSVVELTNEIIDERLKGKGIVRLGDCEGANTPIWFLCTKHWWWWKRSPSGIHGRNGLMCCRVNQNRERGKARNRLRRMTFDAELREKNPNLERVGDYIDMKTKILFKCLVHSTSDKSQIHLCNPGNALSGGGLKCCGVEHGRWLGKKYGNLNNTDRAWRVLTGEMTRTGLTHLYLYESPVEGFNKFGITFDTKARAQRGKYGQKLIDPFTFARREDAVLIEDAYRFGYGIDPPAELADWVGATELTDACPEVFIERIQEFVESLSQLGDWEFVEQFCFPHHIKVARERLGLPDEEASMRY